MTLGTEINRNIFGIILCEGSDNKNFLVACIEKTF